MEFPNHSSPWEQVWRPAYEQPMTLSSSRETTSNTPSPHLKLRTGRGVGAFKWSVAKLSNPGLPNKIAVMQPGRPLDLWSSPPTGGTGQGLIYNPRGTLGPCQTPCQRALRGRWPHQGPGPRQGAASGSTASPH